MNPTISNVSVYTSDGKEFYIEEIILDPETHQPGHLVVRGSDLFRMPVLLPLTFVTDISSDTISLDLNSDVLESFPNYHLLSKDNSSQPIAIGYPQPGLIFSLPENFASICINKSDKPEETVIVERGMYVFDMRGQELGIAAGFIYGKEYRSSKYMILRCEGAFKEERIVPTQLIKSAHKDNIYLTINSAHVIGLGFYQEILTK
jgi:hypothetical protein